MTNNWKKHAKQLDVEVRKFEDVLQSIQHFHTSGKGAQITQQVNDFYRSTLELQGVDNWLELSHEWFIMALDKWLQLVTETDSQEPATRPERSGRGF